MQLAAVGAGGRLDVSRPAPTRLKLRSCDGCARQLDQPHVPVLEAALLVRPIDVLRLECHKRSLLFAGRDRSGPAGARRGNGQNYVRVARTAVSEADLEAIIAAADTLASLDSLPELRQRTVETVAELVPATMVAWNEVDLDGRAIDAVIAPPLDRFTERARDELSAAFIEHVAPTP